MENINLLSKDSPFDLDLNGMDPLQLRHEIMKLRAQIRWHRDQRGHDRCWLDDVTLYKALPETSEADFTLPPREEFLANCARFHETRQPCPHKIDRW